MSRHCVQAATSLLLCRAQAEKARKQETAAHAEVTRLETLLREVRGRFEQRRGDLNSQQTQGAVVKALLQAKQRGDIDGIHGRLGEGNLLMRMTMCHGQQSIKIPLWPSWLETAAHISTRTCRWQETMHACVELLDAGDLGAIDAKFDISVSTACPALDYIVVDTTSAARRCVELLRQRQLGVATFLILEKQRHLAASLQSKQAPPEGACLPVQLM